MTKKFLRNLPARLILLVYGVVVVAPFVWTFYTSFKTSREFYQSPWALPKKITFDNYINAFVKANIGGYFGNSVYLTVLGLVLVTILAIMTSYVLARFQFIFSKFIRTVYLIGLFLPSIFGIVPLFQLMKKLGIYDTLSGLSLVDTMYFLPYTIFILTSFFATIPKEYEEAAIIDGCSYFGTLGKVMTPLAKPAIMTTLIFNTLSFWNEYVMSLVMIKTDAKKTITVGLVNIMEVQKYATDWGALFAGLVIVMIPTFIVYVLMQDKITDGLAAGGIKG